jgi:hypothetical protein
MSKITKSLRDPCEVVRRQTFVLLAKLLQVLIILSVLHLNVHALIYWSYSFYPEGLRKMERSSFPSVSAIFSWRIREDKAFGWLPLWEHLKRFYSWYSLPPFYWTGVMYESGNRKIHTITHHQFWRTCWDLAHQHLTAQLSASIISYLMSIELQDYFLLYVFQPDLRAHRLISMEILSNHAGGLSAPGALSGSIFLLRNWELYISQTHGVWITFYKFS